MRSFLEDLKQRKLVQWALAYLGGAWLIVQVLGELRDTFAWPPIIVQAAVVLLAVGFLGAIVLAWYHGEKGAQRVSGVELLMLAGILTLAGASIAWVQGWSENVALEDAPREEANAPSAPVVEQGSIAVLPFVNMSSDTEQEYFSDGLTEELLNVLAQLPELRVAARTSAFAFKGKDVSVDSVGRALRVAHVLEGSVRKSGDQVRITAQLIDARTGFHLWSRTYDRSLKDIFAVQDEISRAIVDALRLQLAVPGGTSLVRARTTDPEAYTLYLRGRYAWNKRTPEGLQQAVQYFLRATERDPQFAAAFSGLADSYLSLTDYGLLSPAEGLPKVRAAAERALALDSTLAEAHNSLAHLYLHDWKWDAAEREFRRALSLDPGYAPTYHWYSLALTAVGRLNEAVETMVQAQRLDPLSLRMNADLGMAFYAARQYDRAIEQEKKTLELEPNLPVAHWIMGMAYEQKGMYGQAAEAFRQALAIRPGNPNYLASLARAHALAGNPSEARKLLDELLAQTRTGDASPFFIALVYTALGEKDSAFQWLDRAVAERSGSIRYLKVEPRLDSLREDPRFGQLLTAVGLSP